MSIWVQSLRTQHLNKMPGMAMAAYKYIAEGANHRRISETCWPAGLANRWASHWVETEWKKYPTVMLSCTGMYTHVYVHRCAYTHSNSSFLFFFIPPPPPAQIAPSSCLHRSYVHGNHIHLEDQLFINFLCLPFTTSMWISKDFALATVALSISEVNRK